MFINELAENTNLRMDAVFFEMDEAQSFIAYQLSVCLHLSFHPSIHLFFQANDINRLRFSMRTGSL